METGEREPQEPAKIPTVGDLIAALSKFSPNARVIGYFEGCDWQIDEVIGEDDGVVSVNLGERDFESEERRENVTG